jgi:hypothetical protein
VHNVVDGVEFLSMLCFFEIEGAQFVQQFENSCVMTDIYTLNFY